MESKRVFLWLIYVELCENMKLPVVLGVWERGKNWDDKDLPSEVRQP